MSIAPPGAPTISLSSYPPGRAIFTWTPVAQATSYDIKYSTNNGSTWSATTSVSASNPDLTYTTNQDIFGGETLKVSVIPKNDIGAGTEGVATFGAVQNPVWKACTPISPAANYGNDGINWADMGYTYTSSGVVLLRGRIKNAGNPNPTTVCNLPEGYRSDYHIIMRSFTNTQPAYAEAWPDGRVQATYSNTGWFTFDGIGFIPAGSGYTWTSITDIRNGWEPWADYGDNPYAPSRYLVDSMGRTHIEMMLYPGTQTDNTVIANIANSSITGEQYQHIVSASDNFGTGTTAKNATGIVTNGTNLEIRAKGNNVGWLKVHTMVYTKTTGLTASWNPITLTAPFTINAGFTVPGYIKATDGIVSLRGLINQNGTMGNSPAITTLPDAYCPDRGMLFPINNNNNTGIIQVLPSNGTSCSVQIAIAVANTYISLDGIFWKAYK